MLLRVLQAVLFLFAFAFGVYVGNFIQTEIKQPYDRSQFGTSWYDADRNGCDTRNDVLAKQLRDPVIGPDCKVTAGMVTNIYTGEEVPFKTGPVFPIDHIVSLSDAWKSGADKWTAEQRLQFANDLDNLQVTDSTTNKEKSDKGPDEWLPEQNVCDYVKRYVIIKDRYGLEYSASQDRAIQDTGCLK